jgi:hypothetical protein
MGMKKTLCYVENEAEHVMENSEWKENERQTEM